MIMLEGQSRESAIFLWDYESRIRNPNLRKG